MPRTKKIEAFNSFKKQLNKTMMNIPSSFVIFKQGIATKPRDARPIRANSPKVNTDSYYSQMLANQAKFEADLETRKASREGSKIFTYTTKRKAAQPRKTKPLYLIGCTNSRIKCFNHSKSDGMHWWSERV